MGDDTPESRKEAYYRQLVRKLAPGQGRYDLLREQQERREEREEPQSAASADPGSAEPRAPHERTATADEITAFLRRVGGWFRRTPKP